MRLLLIQPSTKLVQDLGTWPADTASAAALPSPPAPGSFYWLSCERTELERQLPAVQSLLQQLCGTPLLDLHISDLLNAQIPSTFDYTSVYPATAEGQRLFTADLIAMLRTHSNVTGLFWWFAEENEKNDAGYTGILSNWINRGLFDNTTGCALPAMDELSRFLEIRE